VYYVENYSFLHMVNTTHVFIWKCIQKYKPNKASSKKRNISEYVIDETAIKAGSEHIWSWIAVEPKDKEILAISISKDGICLLQNYSFQMS
jgi:putative transposase